MPLRFVRSKISAKKVLSVAVTTTSITKELADILQFAPAAAAASLLAVIFETIQSIQSNRRECYQLARRCLSILDWMRAQMEGRREDAPETLLRALNKFENTLESICEYMKTEANANWGSRLLRKTSIEEALSDFHAALDDAATSFQIATLINIHMAIGDRGNSRVQGSTQKTSSDNIATSYSYGENRISNVEEIASSPISDFLLHSTNDSIDAEVVSVSPSSSSDFILVSATQSMTNVITNAFPATVLESELLELNHHGFRQYHQSDLISRGKSVVGGAWWAGAREVNVEGRSSLVKQYDGPREYAAKNWLRDVKILHNVFHPNLPQMIGYSNNETPTPFILLANVQTRLPQALLLDAIKKADIATCVHVLIRFYRDTLDVAIYIQRQLNLSNEKTQDYVENASFRIEAEQTLVMGLPPPEIDNMQSYRNFGLAHSVRGVFLKILPNYGYTRKPYDTARHDMDLQMQQKVNHVTYLARALLSSSEDIVSIIARLDRILGNTEEEWDEDRGHFSLRHIRMEAINANEHQESWFDNTVNPYQLTVGDVGFVPTGADFKSFVVLCNVLGEGSFYLETEASTTQGSWDNGFRHDQQLQAFTLPDNIYGWTVVVPPATKQDVIVVHRAHVNSVNEAWRFLLEHGEALAESYHMQPQDLILVTNVGSEQHLSVRDLRQPFHNSASAFSSPFSNFHSPHVPGFSAHWGHQSRHGQNVMAYHHFSHQYMAPTVLYLFTSPDKEHVSYWSETPIYMKGAASPVRAKCIYSSGYTHGFANYVQLHAEDFKE